MFKARKKDIRRRPMTKTEDESDDEGNVSDASVGTAPIPATAGAAPPSGAGAGAIGTEGRPKKMRKKAKAKVDKGPKPVLSFGHEDEEESGVADKVGKEAKGADGVFRVKRSKASKAMAKAAKDKTELPAAPQNDTARGSWHTATAGMYTAEGLAELRSTQAFTPKTSASTRDRRVRGGGGGGGKSERVFAGDEAEMVHEAGQQGDLKGEGLDDDQMSRLKGQREALLAARQAREKDDGGDDFIPLDGKASLSGAGRGGSLHGGSRGGGTGRGGAGEGAQEVDDEEQQRWEEEQVRRGARQPASKPKPPQQQQQQQQLSGWGAGAFGGSAVALNGGGGGNGWGGTGAERPRFLGVDEMQKALREAGKQLRETHERNERQLQVLVSELATQATEEEKVVSQQKEAAGRFVFFQATRTALSDLCGMLREKESMLSEVESAKRLLHARRLERALEVRADDQEDHLLDTRDAGAVIASLGPYRAAPGGPLSRSPPLTTATGAGATSNGFGRQSPEGGGEDRTRRRGERERRRRRFVRGGGGDGEEWVDSKSFPWGKKDRLEVWQALRSEGEESEGEGEREEKRSRRLMEAAEMVLEDVDDNVKSVAAVKALFENWKRDHGDQYAQAYCTLTLPKLFAPFVRLELVRWDPLTGKVDGIDNASKGNKPRSGGSDQSSRGEGAEAVAAAAAAEEGGGAGAGTGGDETDEGEDDLEGVLERFEWYRRLFDFSGDIPPPESAGYGEEEDPDQNLVPQLVEKVALPLVAERLSTAYDAMSRRQTACLTATVSELLVYDPSEEALKTLLGSALEALQTAVRNLCIPVVGACPTPAARVAAIKLVRVQACRGLKLLRNCLAWRDLLSPQSLVPLALGDLVAKRLIPALRGLAGRGVNGGGITGGKASARAGIGAGVGAGPGAGAGAAEALALYERAVELLPVDWMERPDASAALASLRICARLFGDGLEGGGGGGGGGAVARGGVGVERVVRLQVALGDDGAAKDLARRHGLKIA